MKIKYLGTAAAEGLPALYCDCDTCKYALKTGGKEIRTRSQALIDGKLMLDFPADTYFHALTHGVHLPDVHHYLITHTHSDHFYPDDVEMLGPIYSKLDDKNATYHFYGGSEMNEKIKNAAKSAGKRVEVHRLLPFKTYNIDRFKVTPLKATHGTETPFIYIIESIGKKMLYAHDTGLFLDETLDYLLINKPYFDFVSWDCCSGNVATINYDSHLCMGYIRDIKNKFEKNGISDSRTVHCVNHFSHNGKDVLYKDRKVYEKDGYIMSYDGLEIEF